MSNFAPHNQLNSGRLFGPAGYKPRPMIRSNFIPALMGMCRNVRDEHLDTLLKELRVTPKEMLERYDALSPSMKRNRYGQNYRDAHAFKGNLKELMDQSLRQIARDIQQERQRLKQAVRAEMARLAHLPPGNVMQIVPGNYAEFSALQRYWNRYHSKNCCRTRPAQDEPNRESKSFGLKVTELFCAQTEDSGEDEIYLVSIAVDGNGRVLPQQSPIWDMNEDDASMERVHPHWYIYPMNDPNGFLDTVVRMYDEDGNYAEVGRAMAAVGQAVSAAGAAINPYVAIAGAIIMVAGEIVAIIQSADEDDNLGDVNLEFRSQQTLVDRVGTMTGSFTGDDADYDAKFELLTI